VSRVRLHRCVLTFVHEDGSAYRAESKEMAAEINAGRLFDHAGENRR
jgi:hypothetical protein